MNYHKLLLFFVLINIASITVSNAQVDSSFSVVRNRVTAVFPFKKFKTIEQMKGITVSAFPLYSFNDTHFKRIQGLLSKFVENESQYERLLKVSAEKDSIYKAKEAIFVQNDSIRELKTKNYQEAYNAALSINAQLSEQLKNCTDLAKQEHRKNRYSSALWGLLAGLTTGVLVGVVVR